MNVSTAISGSTIAGMGLAVRTSMRTVLFGLIAANVALGSSACSESSKGGSFGADATSAFAGTSESCASLDSASGVINDAAGHHWTLALGGDGGLIVDVDGAPAGYTDWVAQLVYVDDVVSHKNVSGQWYAWNGGGWRAEPDPTGACSTSDNCTSLTGTNGSLVDAMGNVWTLGNSGAGDLIVDENGMAAGFTANVAQLVWVGQVISHENTSGGWYGWTGSGWSSEVNPTVACKSGGNGGGIAIANAVFFDDFNSLDVGFDGSSSTWMDHFAFGGSEFTLPWNNEAEYLCDSGRNGYQPFSVADGVLTITATSASRSGVGNPGGLPWNSGTLTSCTETNGEPTGGMFARTYGYFEMRAQLPAGPGFWPAFVLYPLSGAGEIDIFEVLGNDPTTLYFSLHASAGGGQKVVKIADSSQAFHTYGCDWQPDFITLYVDGQAKAQMPTPADMRGKPYYINIPFSVGGNGSWPGPTTAATPDPAHFQIDYVGAWSNFASAYPQR
jgi:beta-glucanase (GH16 family)